MWTKDKPANEGWYFWRERKKHNNAWLWHAYYVVDGECWENGTEVHWPKGGQWSTQRVSA